VNGYMLSGKSWRCHECGQQEHETLVDHDETSAVCEGTEIRLTELRNIGCNSSVEKFNTDKIPQAMFVKHATNIDEIVNQRYDCGRQ